MAAIGKLLLSSFGPSPEHDAALADMAGKPLEQIRVAYIENAYDVYDDTASLAEGRERLKQNGYAFELVDLRQWRDDRAGLHRLLEGFDAFLLTGGNPYYLRSLMKVTGADDIITQRVAAGAVYAGASAAAVVAGPTLRHFDELDDPAEAEELIWDGLGLTQSSLHRTSTIRSSAPAAARREISASETATRSDASPMPRRSSSTGTTSVSLDLPSHHFEHAWDAR